MKINLNFLKKHYACSDGVIYFKDKYKDKDIDHKELVNDLITDEKYMWANWLLSKMLSQDNYIRYAIFSAELVLHLFENKFPGDDRPRKAIEIAKKHLESRADTSIALTDDAYAAAAGAARAAARAAGTARAAARVADAAAYAAAYAAADAARAAARAADAAAYAAYATAAYATDADAAAGAARAAARAADAAADAAAADAAADDATDVANVKKETYIKIISYGLEMIGKQK